jgi:choline dehydrogenase-like flavoprotein
MGVLVRWAQKRGAATPSCGVYHNSRGACSGRGYHRRLVETFDYIVVGAGSAGCVLANRLSADGASVLVLEAGGSDAHWLIDMPLGFMRAFLDPAFGWGYRSEPEPQLNGRSLPLPRGRLIGGTSTINGLFFMRGHHLDFDTWRDLGCEGWGFADVLPYFKRMETSWRGAGKFHGGSGPLHVRAIDTRKLLHEPLMRTAAAAGFSTSDDLHAQVQEGFARGEVTIDPRGRRASASRAYLYPALARRNLKLIPQALVTRVLIEKNCAVGVEYRTGGETHKIRAEREVILSGGSYNSPQLLMLSGVGPASELERVGVTPVHDLPGVGKNLSEHARVPIDFVASGPISFLNELRLDRVLLSLARWKLFGAGPFATQINSCNIIIRTRPDLPQPDIQLMSNPVRMDAKVWFPGIAARQEHRITADAVVLHPQSRGAVGLRSANPLDPPRVHVNAFGEQADIDTVIRGIEAARRIYSTPPQSELVASELRPGAGCASHTDLTAYVRQNGGITQHPVGTCKMGIDDAAVVDSQLRVRGIERLRVADASIMPTVTGGNTNAPTIMIGEKASDLILGQRLPPSNL